MTAEEYCTKRVQELAQTGYVINDEQFTERIKRCLVEAVNFGRETERRRCIQIIRSGATAEAPTQAEDAVVTNILHLLAIKQNNVR